MRNVIRAIYVFLISFICLGIAIADNVALRFLYANPHVESPMTFANGNICLTIQTSQNSSKNVLIQTDSNGVAVVDAGKNNKSVTINGIIGCTVWNPFYVYYICYNAGIPPIAENNATIIISNCNQGAGPSCPTVGCPN